jgi:hypothetical protein
LARGEIHGFVPPPYSGFTFSYAIVKFPKSFAASEAAVEIVKQFPLMFVKYYSHYEKLNNMACEFLANPLSDNLLHF